jgi:hypothetical protein
MIIERRSLKTFPDEGQGSATEGRCQTGNTYRPQDIVEAAVMLLPPL